MIHAVISQLSKANLLARAPLILFLTVTGTASNVSGLMSLLDMTKPSSEAERVIQMTDEHVLNSRTLYSEVDHWTSLPGVRPEAIDNETLWLARCIFSETKDPREMILVAWVVRNRVDTGYRGRTSYRSVVLDPFQFSAFNPSSSARYFYSNLKTHSKVYGWDAALRAAYQVRTADRSERPFSERTRHFYSERSMVGRSMPLWAGGIEPVDLLEQEIDEKRFRFYEGIS